MTLVSRVELLSSHACQLGDIGQLGRPAFSQDYGQSRLRIGAIGQLGRAVVNQACQLDLLGRRHVVTSEDVTPNREGLKSNQEMLLK